MMITAAANHRPTRDKYLGPQESSVDPSFLMYPPPNKKAKFRHHTDDDSNSHNSSEGAQHYNDDNDDRHILSSSPTDVLTHPTAAASNNTAGVNNSIFPAAVVKTLPPSLKGIAEAARGLNLSLRNNIHNSSSLQQKSSPSTRPQLVAFPTEALYVLTCCVKTTSKKKIIRANAAAAAAAASNSRNHDDSSTSSSSLVYSSSANSSDRERQDLGGKPSSRDDDIHPSNPSLECLLSRQTPPNQEEEEVKLSSRASVFVIDSKHAQHYCQFSRPKSFAIRPKQPSPSSSDLATVHSSGSSSLAASAAESGGDMDHSVSKSGAASKLDQLNQDEQKLGWGCSNNTYTPSSPKESSSTRAGERTPGCAMVGSTSSSSLCGPMTPDVGTANRTPLSTLSLAAAVTPIAKNTAIAHMDDSKMPPSLPLSNQNTPSNNHSRFNALGTNKILAVNFSESYEAFSRLANKFWPGPVIIYAPARMITVGDTGRQDTPSSSSLQQQSQSWKRSSSNASSSSSSSCPSSSSSSSCPSLPSFTNLYNLEKGEGSGNNSQEVPVLPPSVLIPARDLLFDNDGMTTTTNNNKEDQLFIGMQCPSHPLARKILTEMYRPRRGPTSTTTSSSPSLPMAHSTSTESFASFASLDASTTKQQQHVRCGIAVVGSYITPSSNGSGGNEDETKGNTTTTVLSNSATNVTKILSSSSSSSDNTNPKRGGTEQIYVVNGEDTTHENFSVPTCNYGGVSPMSLVVDGDNRTIYLLRNHHHYRNSEFVGGGGGGCNTVVNKDKIYRALLQPPSSLKSATTAVNVDNNCSNGKASSMREMDRVITAVLSRWKVVERHV